MKLKKLGAGFYGLVVSLVCAIVAFIMYFLTFNAFHYSADRWVTALTVIALWAIAFLLINAIVSDDTPFYVDIFYVIAVFTLTLAMIMFLLPCLSPIGIYFTVHNMGDVEANAIGVPRSIVCIVFFAISIIGLLVSAFLKLTGKEKKRV